MMPKGARRPHGCLLLGAALLVAALAVGAVGAGMRRGLIEPPETRQQIGPVTLYAVVTLDPQCPLAFCGAQHMDSRMQQYYMVWLVIVWPGSGAPRVTSRTLLLTPIDRYSPRDGVW